MRTAGRSAFKDLLLSDGDWLAPPALVTCERDVPSRDSRGFALGVADREREMVAGGEVGGVLLPRRPFLRRRAPHGGEHHRGQRRYPDALPSHRCLLP